MTDLTVPVRRAGLPVAAAAFALAALVVSGIQPRDRGTWVLETFWIMIGLPLAVALRRRFPLTGLLCALLAPHALVLSVEGHLISPRTARPSGRRGTQGDVWDTQWDMFCALVGSVLALLLLGRVHDRQLDVLDPRGAGSRLR